MQNEISNWKEWEHLFNQATLAERQEIFVLMIRMIEDRQNRIIELCKKNPLHLEALPLPKLKEMAQMVTSSASVMIASALSESGNDFLIPTFNSFEGLTVFSLSTDEPTASEVKDAIEDIKTVFSSEEILIARRKEGK